MTFLIDVFLFSKVRSTFTSPMFHVVCLREQFIEIHLGLRIRFFPCVFFKKYLYKVHVIDVFFIRNFYIMSSNPKSYSILRINISTKF